LSASVQIVLQVDCLPVTQVTQNRFLARLNIFPLQGALLKDIDDSCPVSASLPLPPPLSLCLAKLALNVIINPKGNYLYSLRVHPFLKLFSAKRLFYGYKRYRKHVAVRVMAKRERVRVKRH
jgi:hypothetical protein